MQDAQYPVTEAAPISGYVSSSKNDGRQQQGLGDIRTEHAVCALGVARRVRLDALLAVTRHCAAGYQLHCWANASGDALGRRPVARGRRCLHLHPCFASSIRMARVRPHDASLSCTLLQLSPAARCRGRCS